MPCSLITRVTDLQVNALTPNAITATSNSNALPCGIGLFVTSKSTGRGLAGKSRKPPAYRMNAGLFRRHVVGADAIQLEKWTQMTPTACTPINQNHPLRFMLFAPWNSEFYATLAEFPLPCFVGGRIHV
jgi:hypothetical protein